MPKQPASKTAPHIALAIAAHAFVLLLVTVIPVLVFEAIASYAQDGHKRAHAFDFIGGITYPLYIGYWLLKAKSFTFKLTTLHLLTLVTLTIFVTNFCDVYKLPTVQVMFPIVWSLLAAPVAAVAHTRGQSFFVRGCVTSLLTSFPLALLMSALLAYAQGMSSMAGMRW
jgi:hypothetical protein